MRSVVDSNRNHRCFARNIGSLLGYLYPARFDSQILQHFQVAHQSCIAEIASVSPLWSNNQADPETYLSKPPLRELLKKSMEQIYNEVRLRSALGYGYPQSSSKGGQEAEARWLPAALSLLKAFRLLAQETVKSVAKIVPWLQAAISRFDQTSNDAACF